MGTSRRRRVTNRVVMQWRALGRAGRASDGPAMRSTLRAAETLLALGCRRLAPWAIRVSLAVVYLWFGVVKLLGRSEASPLALALTAKTVGAAHFDAWFNGLAVVECVIGALVLVPSARRVVFPAIAIHMGVVCAPLVLVPEHAWQSLLVPTLEGQYIIKNVLVIAALLALGGASLGAPAPPVERPVVQWGRSPSRRADRLALGLGATAMTVATIALWTTVHQPATSAGATTGGAAVPRPVAELVPAQLVEPTAQLPTVLGPDTPAPGPSRVTLVYTPGALALTGEVADQESVDELMTLASGMLPPSTVTSTLVIDAAAPPAVPRLRMAADVVFGAAGPTVRLEFAPVVVTMAGFLREHPGLAIEVHVHTDDHGAAGLTLDETTAQTAALAAVLVAQGVEPDRIVQVPEGSESFEHVPAAAVPSMDRWVEVVVRDA